MNNHMHDTHATSISLRRKGSLFVPGCPLVFNLVGLSPKKWQPSSSVTSTKNTKRERQQMVKQTNQLHPLSQSSNPNPFPMETMSLRHQVQHNLRKSMFLLTAE